MFGKVNLVLAAAVSAMLCLLAPITDAAVIFHSRNGERNIIVDLPVISTTTINKTVHIDAPAGATVIYTDMPVYPVVSPYPHYPSVLPYPPVTGFSGISLRPVGGACLRTDDVSSDWRPVALVECSNGEISEAMYFSQGQVWLNNRCLAVRNNAVGTVSCALNRENNWLLANRQLRERNSNLCMDGTQGSLLLQPCRNIPGQQFH